jgi:hypothetical protein
MRDRAAATRCDEALASLAIPAFLAQARENLTGNARALWMTGIGTMRGQVGDLTDLEQKVASSPSSTKDLREAVTRGPQSHRVLRRLAGGKASSKTGRFSSRIWCASAPTSSATPSP